MYNSREYVLYHFLTGDHPPPISPGPGPMPEEEPVCPNFKQMAHVGMIDKMCKDKKKGGKSQISCLNNSSRPTKSHL